MKTNLRREEVCADPDPPVTTDDNLIEDKNSSPLEPEAPQKKRRRKGLGIVPLFLLKLVLTVALFVFVFTFVLGIHIQQGNRMYPSIKDGDLVILYKLDTYRVGDVVAYRRPDNGKTDLARIIAIGENTVNIMEYGELIINNVRVTESVFYPTKPLEDSRVGYPFQMSGKGIFLLDDYRTIGSDSRLFGEIDTSRLCGKVVYVIRRRGI